MALVAFCNSLQKYLIKKYTTFKARLWLDSPWAGCPHLCLAGPLPLVGTEGNHLQPTSGCREELLSSEQQRRLSGVQGSLCPHLLYLYLHWRILLATCKARAPSVTDSPNLTPRPGSEISHSLDCSSLSAPESSYTSQAWPASPQK